jgi:threonine synthase
MRQFCTKCGKSPGDEFQTFCECGGFTEMEYDLKQVKLHDSPNPYVRFADLLPVKELHHRLPQDSRYTPTVHAKKLGQLLGMPSLYLKDETVLPTRSTKDRMAFVSLAYLCEHGVRSFCISSTGNSSTACTNAIRSHPAMRVFVFTAESFIRRVQHAEHGQVRHFGLHDASFVEAFEAATAYAKANGHTSETGFFNLGRREGLKIAFLEAAEQIPQPIDWYVQAVSSAMGVYGTYKGAKELFGLRRIDRLPKLMCVQQENCSPMVRAFNESSETIQPHHIVPKPRGIAEAILRGNPTRVYPYIRQIVIESDGMCVAVSEDEIREARRMVEELEGLSPCFSASTAMAGLIKQVCSKSFPVKDTVMVNLTGGERTGEPAPKKITWMQRGPNGWVEESTPNHHPQIVRSQVSVP